MDCSSCKLLRTDVLGIRILEGLNLLNWMAVSDINWSEVGVRVLELDGKVGRKAAYPRRKKRTSQPYGKSSLVGLSKYLSVNKRCITLQ